MKPTDVNKQNAALVWERLYGNDERHKKTFKNVKEGDRVRISKVKGHFQKKAIGLRIGLEKRFLLIKSIRSFYLPWPL